MYNTSSLRVWTELANPIQSNTCHVSYFLRLRLRWEQERRQLQAYDVDRARDLAGLKRAVEAQSQLVMENLVAAQR